MTTPNPNLQDQSLSKGVEAAIAKGSSLRIYSNSTESLKVLEQRVAKLEELGILDTYHLEILSPILF